MSDAASQIGQEQATRDRIAIEAEQQCPACSQALWVSFYFDGFGYSDKEGPRSNVVKLFQAAYDFADKGMRRFYYPGLGANFDPETTALAAAVGGIAGDKAKDTASGAVEDSAKDAGKGVLSGAGEAWSKRRARGGSLLESAGDAWDGAWNSGRKQVRKATGEVKRVVRDPGKFVEKKLRRLRGEWRDFWREVTRHPFRSITGGAAKQAAKQGIDYAGGSVAEGVGLIRDSKLAAGLFNTGVDTRLESAKKDFLSAVAQAKRQSPLDHINVALFGYDMGGGLALAFCKQLFEDVCSGGRLDGVSVHVRFLGLFDCVTNRYDDNFLTGYMPLSNEVSSELLLPDTIERCVHYAAAHELRFYKPLSIIGADPELFSGRRQEQLFPGAQEDVGGGAESDVEGTSDQLSRYPLQMMYNRAYGAGVPMPSLVELENHNPDLHALIVPDSSVAKFQTSYRNAVKSLVSVTRTITPELMRLQNPFCGVTGLSQGSAGDGRCMVPPEPVQYTELPKNVEEQYKGHIAIYIQWLRMWYDQNATRAQERTGPLGLGAAVDPYANARYQKLADELSYLERNARSGPGFDMGQAKKQIDGEVVPSIFTSDPQGQALYWIWRNADKASEQVKALFPGFMTYTHDSMGESALESAYGSFVMSRHYFNRRPMQKLATKPDPSFLEKLENIYKAIVE